MTPDRRLSALADIFGVKDVQLHEDRLTVLGVTYPVVDGVIVVLRPESYTPYLRARLTSHERPETASPSIAAEIQSTFGQEWHSFPDILPEHESEFAQYFDIVDITKLSDSRICDLGCGIGRWSYFLADKCRELVLVDFSDAIFVARRNLSHLENVHCFMGDLRQLPFRDDFADFVFSIGVLHHLPVDALGEARALRRLAPRLLLYLYYALDNRPLPFRIVFLLVNQLRRRTARVTNRKARAILTWLLTLIFYAPMVGLGRLVRPLGLSNSVPLYEAYRGKSFKRIRQDAYDRFFTSIEQRFRRNQIMDLEDAFARVVISPSPPFWHFVCLRERPLG